jgi:hypothetical protein
MDSFLKRVSVVSLIASFYFIGAANPISGRMDDHSTASRLRKQGIKHTTQRAILWVEKNYLSKEEIEEFGSFVDKGIIRAEEYLGVTFDKEHYKGDKVHYFIKGGRFISHVFGGYRHKEFRKPIVFLSFVKEGKSPYLHETVHILAWESYSLWIREGLAVYLNDKLGGYPAFPNFGKDIDECAKEYLNRKFRNTLRLIGNNGIPEFSDRMERRIFYLFSGSFVKFLDGEIGTEKLMDIYKAKNTKQAFKKISGQKVEEWKKVWVNSLGGQF